MAKGPFQDRGRTPLAALALAATLGGASPALAQADLFSGRAFSGQIDVRIGAANGEQSWVDGGFGKARFGGEEGNWSLDAEIADAIVEWRPQFTGALSGVVTAEFQSDQDHPFGLGEAYLRYKPLRPGPTRFSGRLGSFYPPVSLEHDGRFWTVSRTITPSAINSWISEEVQGAGLELTVRRTLGDHELGLTAGTVMDNDTAGTLLGFRGWSLSDQRATLDGDYPLPPLSAFLTSRQRAGTTPHLELDHRMGYYLRADWRPPAPVAINLVHYDNGGDLISVNDEVEWAWLTTFTNVGVIWRVDSDTEVLAQAMWGKTLMGYPFPAGVWVDVDYEAAYVLATRDFGEIAVSGRLDAFSTMDNASPLYGDNSEDGWAATLALRREVGHNTQVFLEATHIASNRPGRALAGEARRQDQTVLQAAGRFVF